jgi:predicted HicB family RNase H-like nuclease
MGRRGQVTKYPEAVSVRIGPDVHTELRILAAVNGESIAQYVRRLVKDGIEREMRGQQNGTQ